MFRRNCFGGGEVGPALLSGKKQSTYKEGEPRYYATRSREELRTLRMMEYSLRSAGMSVRGKEENVLEEYNVTLQGFHDSLKGLSSAIEEAQSRCEQARRACEVLRVAYQNENTQRKPPRSTTFCAERDRLQEQCVTAVESYHDALDSLASVSLVVYSGQEPEKIERIRKACNHAFKLLEDHEREHRCRQQTSSQRSSKASSA
jgi:hypothetical protein